MQLLFNNIPLSIVMIQIIVVCYCEDAVCRVNLMKLIKIWPRFHKPTMPLLLQR